MGGEGGRNSAAKKEEEHYTFLLLLCFLSTISYYSLLYKSYIPFHSCNV